MIPKGRLKTMSISAVNLNTHQVKNNPAFGCDFCEQSKQIYVNKGNFTVEEADLYVSSVVPRMGASEDVHRLTKKEVNAHLKLAEQHFLALIEFPDAMIKGAKKLLSKI